MDLLRGTFRVRGDVIEVAPGHTDSFILRIEMFDDEIERICEVDPLTGKVLNAYTVYVVYPASGYATKQEIINRAANTIEEGWLTVCRCWKMRASCWRSSGWNSVRVMI